MSPDEELREPNQDERALFDFLLQEGFPGRNELKTQLATAKVRTIDEMGSLAIEVQSGLYATVVRRIPVEAYGNDKDGVRIHLLLHVVEGLASELQVFKEDGSLLKARLEPKELTLFLPDDAASRAL